VITPVGTEDASLADEDPVVCEAETALFVVEEDGARTTETDALAEAEFVTVAAVAEVEATELELEIPTAVAGDPVTELELVDAITAAGCPHWPGILTATFKPVVTGAELATLNWQRVQPLVLS
jgi:hypothetical protein